MIQQAKLLELVRQKIRLKHYSIRTEESYIGWIKLQLEAHLKYVKKQHEADLSQGYGLVFLPDALERKYPNANREWGWQYVFPFQHDIRTIQKLLGHKDVNTTMIYTHLLNKEGRAVRSPLDRRKYAGHTLLNYI